MWLEKTFWESQPVRSKAGLECTQGQAQKREMTWEEKEEENTADWVSEQAVETVGNHHRRSSQSHQCFGCGLKRGGQFRGNRIWNDSQQARIKRARVSGHKFLEHPPNTLLLRSLCLLERRVPCFYFHKLSQLPQRPGSWQAGTQWH